MSWMILIIAVLVLFSAGYMLFDGIRALIVGDFITPTAGEYAGQLGPWASLVNAVGIEPRSTLMKLVFIIYGVISLITLTGFVLKQPWGQPALIVTSILGLWYLPFGTFSNIIVLVLLFLNRS